MPKLSGKHLGPRKESRCRTRLVSRIRLSSGDGLRLGQATPSRMVKERHTHAQNQHASDQDGNSASQEVQGSPPHAIPFMSQDSANKRRSNENGVPEGPAQ